jgi:hypothetical protein
MIDFEKLFNHRGEFTVGCGTIHLSDVRGISYQVGGYNLSHYHIIEDKSQLIAVSNIEDDLCQQSYQLVIVVVDNKDSE